MNSRITPHLLGVVLAGGRSSRMGRPKATLTHPDGGTYLQHALRRISHCCDHVACSLAEDQSDLAELLPRGTTLLIDRKANRGPVQGLAEAFVLATALRCTGILVTPVDVPNVTVQQLELLKKAFVRNSDQVVCAADRQGDDTLRLQPLVAIYPISFHDKISDLAASQHRSLSRFVGSTLHQSIEFPSASLLNVNHPDDLPS